MTSPILGQSSPQLQHPGAMLCQAIAKGQFGSNFEIILALFGEWFGTILAQFAEDFIDMTQRAVRGEQALQKRALKSRKKERCGVRLPFRRRKTGSHRIPMYSIH